VEGACSISSPPIRPISSIPAGGPIATAATCWEARLSLEWAIAAADRLAPAAGSSSTPAAPS
jgi:hypothetical protein